MTSSRPYLIRAIHQWIVDNGLTPQIIVDAEVEGVDVPRQFVEDQKVVLNISPTAVRDLELGNQTISFSARFAGASHQVTVPARAVLAVYARENGVGMAFQEEPEDEPPDTPSNDKSGRPALRVVK